MKQIVSNYSYSPTTNVVTLTGVNIDADQLLLIVAPEVGRTMYNFASGVTGTVSAGANTRVTLNASTAGLTTTSPLVIFYDDQLSTQTIAGTVTAGMLNVENSNNSFPNQNSPVQLKASPNSGSLRVRMDYNSIDDGSSSSVVGTTLNEDPSPAAYVRSKVVAIPAISGTVTANFASTGIGGGSLGGYNGTNSYLHVGIQNIGQIGLASSTSLPVSGTVTIGNTVTVAGTVTANSSNGTLTTRFGTPVTANTAFATSAVTNASRKYLLIQNVTTGSNVITVGIGFTPTTTQGIQLTAGAGITFESSYIPTGAVMILSSVTASNFTILEA
jgi:hypothetical protein